jgi:asparagine synthase (glutamine-hydrolysing)
MCGICGIVDLGADDPGDDGRLARMLEALTPRGPDEQGSCTLSGARLGVRRLRVIDLATGSQPMRTDDGRLTMVFNGEIYNFRDLRRDLEARGHRFRTHSDTETVLLGFREWSSEVFDRLDGMFGVAIWIAPSKTLILARDRIGEKPLYWSQSGDRLVFASEMRAILHGLRRPLATDRTALARYLFYGYSPSPDSLLQGVFKLRPAEILTFSSGTVRLSRFWAPPAPRIPAEASLTPEEFRNDVLPAAVRSRLVSDVPVGAFLSGGIDSTIVVDQMAQAGAAPQTFCIGFDDASFDESGKARAVARQLGTRHTERVFTEQELLALLARLNRIVDEPLADPSILPTYLLSRTARERVTVALSGDGGDELFGGYPTYVAHRWVEGWNGAGRIAAPFARTLGSFLPTSDANLSLDFKLAKLGLGLGQEPAWRHALWMSHCSPDQISDLMPDLGRANLRELLLEPITRRLEGYRFETDRDLAMHLDLTMYLADGVLVKVDRASMACSLETRAPFLARAVVDYARSLPAASKVDRSTTKKPLRAVLASRYPESLVAQPKKGFGIPVSRWLRTIGKETIRERLPGLSVEVAAVTRLWNEHQNRRANHRMPLWALFVLGAWEESLRDAGHA